MPAPKGNKFAAGNKGGGRKSIFQPHFVDMARALCRHGATDFEIAHALGVSMRSVDTWKVTNEEFRAAFKEGKDAYDDRVERALFSRATGYSVESQKIFMKDGKAIKVDYVEHIPPDVTAAIFWLKNRRKADWRDKNETEVVGGLTHSGGVTLQIVSGVPRAPDDK